MELKTYFATDAGGGALPNAQVTVYFPAGQQVSLATIFDSDEQPLTNPFNATDKGLIQFSAANGLYDIRVKSGARDFTIPDVQFQDYLEALETINEQTAIAVASASAAQESETAAEEAAASSSQDKDQAEAFSLSALVSAQQAGTNAAAALAANVDSGTFITGVSFAGFFEVDLGGKKYLIPRFVENLKPLKNTLLLNFAGDSYQIVSVEYKTKVSLDFAQDTYILESI